MLLPRLKIATLYAFTNRATILCRSDLGAHTSPADCMHVRTVSSSFHFLFYVPLEPANPVRSHSPILSYAVRLWLLLIIFLFIFMFLKFSGYGIVYARSPRCRPNRVRFDVAWRWCLFLFLALQWLHTYVYHLSTHSTLPFRNVLASLWPSHLVSYGDEHIFCGVSSIPVPHATATQFMNI